MDTFFATDGMTELLALVLALALAGALVADSYNGKFHLTRFVPIHTDGFGGMLKTRYGNTFLSIFIAMVGVSVYISIDGVEQSEAPMPGFIAYLPAALTVVLVAIYWHVSFAPLFRLYTDLRSASSIPKPLGLLVGERLALGSTFTRDPLDHTASIIQRIKFDYVLLNEYQLQKLGENAPTPSFVVYDGRDPAAASALQVLPSLVRSFPVERSDAPAARDVDAVLGIHETSIGINHAILTAISGFGTYPEDLTTSGNATIGQLVRTVFTVENPSQKLMVALNVYEVLLKQTVFLGLARQGTVTIPVIAERYSDPLRGTLLDSPRTWLHILHHLSTEDRLLREMVMQRVEPAQWSEAVLPIIEYLKLENSGDHTAGTLFDLLELIVFFRNKTRGHGIIRDQTALLVLPMFMKTLMLALHMAGSERLSTAIDPADGSVAFSGPDGLWPAGDLVVYDETIGDFAYLSEIRRNKVKMIAYIAGEYVVPSRRTLNVQREGLT